jgi:epsilon-lactone hydrolase
MSKQQLAAILEMGAQNPPPANATPAEMRAWIEGVASQLPVAENVQIKRVNCGPCDGDLILPAGGDASRLIIFYHGGGFFFGSSRTHRVIASNLARAAGGAPYWCQTIAWLRNTRPRPPTMMHSPCISGR